MAEISEIHRDRERFLLYARSVVEYIEKHDDVVGIAVAIEHAGSMPGLLWDTALVGAVELLKRDILKDPEESEDEP